MDWSFLWQRDCMYLSSYYDYDCDSVTYCKKESLHLLWRMFWFHPTWAGCLSIVLHHGLDLKTTQYSVTSAELILFVYYYLYAVIRAPTKDRTSSSTKPITVHAVSIQKVFTVWAGVCPALTFQCHRVQIKRHRSLVVAFKIGFTCTDVRQKMDHYLDPLF